MANMTATTMATYLAEVWSRLTSIEYKSNVVLPDRFDRRWEPEIGVGRGDTVNIPRFTQNGNLVNTGSPAHVGQKRSTFGTSAALVFTAVTEAQIQLLIDQMAIEGYNIPAEISAQAMLQYEPLLTRGIGEAIALQIDFELADTLIDAFPAVGTDNVDITDDDILECETNLDNVNAPMAMRTLVLSPASRGSLMKIEAIRNQLYKDTVGNINRNAPGFLGNVYSFDVFRSNNLENGSSGKKNGAFQMEAAAFAQQKGITVERQLQIVGSGALDSLVVTVVGYSTYGFKEIVNAFGNELDGK